MCAERVNGDPAVVVTHVELGILLVTLTTILSPMLASIVGPGNSPEDAAIHLIEIISRAREVSYRSQQALISPRRPGHPLPLRLQSRSSEWS